MLCQIHSIKQQLSLSRFLSVSVHIKYNNIGGSTLYIYKRLDEETHSSLNTVIECLHITLNFADGC